LLGKQIPILTIGAAANISILIDIVKMDKLQIWLLDTFGKLQLGKPLGDNIALLSATRIV
jgi:hypothetical protein